MGSASELQHHLLLARDLNLFNTDEYRKFDSEATGVKKMLSALIERTRFKPKAESRQPKAATQGKS
jgi:four helix bundle protein